MKAKAYIVSMDRKTTVYELEAGKTAFVENAYKLSIATRVFHGPACEFELISLL